MTSENAAIRDREIQARRAEVAKAKNRLTKATDAYTVENETRNVARAEKALAFWEAWKGK